jgi:hypothetical protein
MDPAGIQNVVLIKPLLALQGMQQRFRHGFPEHKT